jgi:Ca-activated chloride channel homolog
MEFESPYMLWLGIVIPVLTVGYLWAQRRRRQYAERYASLSFVRQALVDGPGVRRHVPPVLFLAGLAVMIVAMARPMAVLKVPSESGIVVLAIDTSGSMVADDVKPTRMDAAKAAARAYVENQPKGIRIAVVSFSDNAAEVQSPTIDHDAVIAAIDHLVPQRGTAIGLGLQTAVEAIFDAPGTLNPNANALGNAGLPGPAGSGNPRGFAAEAPLNPSVQPSPPGTEELRTIILVTDGENNEGPDPIDVARQVTGYAVRIFTIGIGSPQGAIVHVQGEDIPTKLDEDTLKQIAENADGAYFNAMTDTDLKTIYASLGNRLVLRTTKTEMTVFLTGWAAVLSIVGGVLAFLWLGRPA